MRSDDLVPVLAGDGGGRPLGLTQGTVNSWNTTTGANSVTINGTIFSNLKVIGPTSGIATNDEVMVLKWGSGSWYVLGKLTNP